MPAVDLISALHSPVNADMCVPQSSLSLLMQSVMREEIISSAVNTGKGIGSSSESRRVPPVKNWGAERVNSNSSLKRKDHGLVPSTDSFVELVSYENYISINLVRIQVTRVCWHILN